VGCWLHIYTSLCHRSAHLAQGKSVCWSPVEREEEGKGGRKEGKGSRQRVRGGRREGGGGGGVKLGRKRDGKGKREELKIKYTKIGVSPLEITGG